MNKSLNLIIVVIVAIFLASCMAPPIDGSSGGGIGGGTLVAIVFIAGFIYFMFKIHDKKNESNSFRNALFMAVIGIVALILSFTITNENDKATSFKTVLLICATIYTLYGGFYAINKYAKNNNNNEN